MKFCSSRVSRSYSGRLWLSFIPFFLTACQLASTPFGQSTVPIIEQPVTSIEEGNLANLLAAAPESADLTELYLSFNPNDTVAQPAKRSWQLGDIDRFFYTEQANETIVEVDARAAYVSEQLIMWVEDGVRFDSAALQAAAVQHETEILPTSRGLFGREPSPGIDQNRAIHILHIGNMGGSTIGYFSGKDEYPRQVASNSNEREMFYINLRFVEIGTDDYFDVVAHEFEHMIMWNLDRNEHTWINEGLAELSTTANGFGPSDFLPAFLEQPDSSLTAFNYEGGDYAAAWLMMAWLRERYGDPFITDLVEQPQNSVQGIEHLLRSYDPGVNFEEIYAKWMVALYGANHNLNLENGFRFESMEPFLSRAQRIEPVKPRTGQRIQTTVGQYGSDYWEIPTNQTTLITITPTQQVSLMSGDPADGQWYWTTVPADFSNMHLTRQVDLSSVSSAQLSFDAYYDIEIGYDYAYVSISADGGQSWQLIDTSVSVETDPHRKNYGFGITGISGDGDTPEWTTVTADLTPFTGDGSSDLLLRFQKITDDAVQHEGLAIDNISIPEIGWSDGAENGVDGWNAVGFVRHTNRIPQTFVVQTIEVQSDNSAGVIIHQPAANGSYQLEINPSANLDHVILAIAGTTPITKQPAGYHLLVTP